MLDRKDKEVWEGTKYSDISDLFDKLHNHHVFNPDYVYQPPVVSNVLFVGPSLVVWSGFRGIYHR